MEIPSEHRFIFASCQAGAEPALKAEVSRDYPELRFAFSRPGFVTFKSPSELSADFALHSVFARAYGLSLGDSKATDPRDRALAASKAAAAIAGKKPLKLHVWSRDDKANEDTEVLAPAALAEVALRDVAPEAFAPPGSPEPGDLVFDLIVLEPGHWFFGFHEHTSRHSRDSGGRPLLLLPDRAPSRAYLKLEEALRWSAIELKPGETAVEIGSAPGGATYALLERGLAVTGIDPAAMDPAVLEFGGSKFKHVRKGVADVTPRDLPSKFEWLLLDMNVPPQIAFEALAEIRPMAGQSLLGAILTLKLNRWRIAGEIPDMLAGARKLGFERAEAIHLPSNRQEFCMVGLTQEGLGRAGSGPLRS